MKCPYCQKEMTAGFIKSSHHMAWDQKRESGFFLEGIRLTKNSIENVFNGNAVSSHYCSNCRKIIVSLEENGI